MNHSTTASGTQAATGSAAAGVAAGSRERSDPRVVLADRVEQLYSQLPLGIAATVVIGLISALELREGRIIELVAFWRSEEHTSELQSHSDLVCRLLLEKKKKIDKH